jgi:hypothetical protein
MRENLIIIMVFAVFSLLLGTGFYFIAKASCAAKTEQSSFNHQFAVFSGCLIETKEGWLPLQNYRIINNERRGSHE